MLSRSNSISSRRSLQLQQSLDPDKQYKVTLPDNQVMQEFIGLVVERLYNLMIL